MCNWDVLEVVEGAKEVLEHLSKNHKIYIATGAVESTEEEIKIAFDRVDLSKFITGYFCKNNLGVNKGTSLFFEIILEKLNITNAEVTMVGDSLYKDIIPANSIGIKTIFLSKTDYIDVPKNTKKISNLNELYNLIEGI